MASLPHGHAGDGRIVGLPSTASIASAQIPLASRAWPIGGGCGPLCSWLSLGPPQLPVE